MYYLFLGTPSGPFIDFARQMRPLLLAPPRGFGTRVLGNIAPTQMHFVTKIKFYVTVYGGIEKIREMGKIEEMAKIEKMRK